MPVIAHIIPNPDLPSRADAVIIGGGIIGISTALELAERGLFVVVVEKGEVGAEQSSRNWGWCRQMGRDSREVPLIKVALAKWRGMNERIGAETGFRTCGIVYMSDTAETFAKKQAWFESVAKPHALSTRVVSGSEIGKLVPGCLKSWSGGIYTADDGRAEPFLAVPAMAKALQKKGARVFTNCAARGLEQSAGRVSAVVTEKGVIQTDTVIVAGGYWTRRFLDSLDVSFPQIGVVNSVMRTQARDTGLTHTISGGLYAVRKRMDGGFTIAHNHLSVAELTPTHFRHALAFSPLLKLDRAGVRIRVGKRFFDEARMPRRWALDKASPFEAVRVLDPAPYVSILDEAYAALQSDFPAFEGLPVAERWAGMIDAVPDAVPVIDRIEKIPGLFVASGFSGHGFGLGPGAGQLMAEIVTGETPCVDPAPFRQGRFTGFARPAPTTGL